jgi:hypothetical protein
MPHGNMSLKIGQHMKNTINSSIYFMHYLSNDIVMTSTFANLSHATCSTQLQVTLVANVVYSKKIVAHVICN